ncbi:hypothetical protein BD779DRAFT_1138362 [Infundibulicybe gibba]|nr:hypothetical protein BD779DRAFT_1138362 [Infundibulicybe gibba]
MGSLLRIYCFRTMGRFYVFDRRIEDDHKLITSGPYRVVRHPAYSAFILEFPGAVLLYMSRGSLLKESGFLDTRTGMGVVVAWLTMKLVADLILMRTTPLEDAALRGKFGKEWDEWAQRVPCRLIPVDGILRTEAILRTLSDCIGGTGRKLRLFRPTHEITRAPRGTLVYKSKRMWYESERLLAYVMVR